MGHSSFPGFGLTSVDIEPPIVNPDITDEITQTLDRLMVFDKINGRFVLVTGNADGAVLVTQAAPSIQAPSVGRINVPVAVTRLFNVNNLRKQIILQNDSAFVIFIGFTSAMAITTRWTLAQNDFLSIDTYVGEIWGTSPLGLISIQFIEV